MTRSSATGQTEDTESKKSFSRRKLMTTAGVVGAGGLAGCLGGGGGGGDGGDGGDGDGGDGGDGGGQATTTTKASKSKKLNILTWGGYKPIAKMMEKKHGAKTNVKLISSDTKAFNLLKGGGWRQFDVIVTDNTWAVKMAKADLLEPLEKEWFPSRKSWVDRFGWGYETFRWDGKQWAIPPRWGWVGLGFNSKKVSREEINHYDFLWTGGPNGKFKDMVHASSAAWGIPLLCLELGYDPYNLSDSEWQDVKDKLFQMFQTSVGATSEATASMRQSMLNENTIVAFNQGNFGLSQLRVEGYDFIKGHIPQGTVKDHGKGAVSWVEAGGLIKEPHNRELAIQFLNEALSPKGQFKICYSAPTKGGPTNTKAFDKFSKEQERTTLMYKNKGFEAIDEILGMSTQFQVAPRLQQWLDAWSQAKAKAGF